MTDEVKKYADEILKDWHSPFPNIKYLRYYSKFNNLNDSELSEINNYLIIKNAERDLNLLSNFVTVEEFIDLNSQIAANSIYLNLGYLPCREASRVIVNFSLRSSECKIENWKTLKDAYEGMTIWDLFSVFDKYEVDPHVIHCFQCSILNDTKYFNSELYYLGASEHPFKTGKRFSGFLAHLFYANYKEEYGDMFGLVVKTVERNFARTMPLAVFLLNFVKENDPSKISIVEKLIDDFKKENPDYDWSKPLKDCYRFGRARKCVVGREDKTIAEIFD